MSSQTLHRLHRCWVGAFVTKFVAELAPRLLRAGDPVGVLHLWLEAGQGDLRVEQVRHCIALGRTALHCTALHRCPTSGPRPAAWGLGTRPGVENVRLSV